MREYWDARADEDPFFFVDNRREYGARDEAAFWAGGEEAVGTILRILEASIKSTDDVVEIGCGVGRITRALAKRSASVRALDVSARMIEQAKELNPELDKVTWIVGDGVSLAPIENATADVCFSHVVFQHIPDPQVTLAYVSEMGRVLKPGGWSAFQISNLPDLHKPPRGLSRIKAVALALAGRGPKGQSEPEWLGSAIDLADLEAAAIDAGMLSERIAYEGTQHCLVLLRRQS